MTAPTITSITPSSGLAVGDVFVEIVGTNFNLQAQGSITVTFGGKPAVRSAVISATRLFAVAPAGDPDAGSTPGAVDVVVTNTTPQPPGSPLVESATKVKAFTYKRPSIATPNNLTNHSSVALVTRTLVTEFQRAVLKNTQHDRHPDYASLEAALRGETDKAESPSLKILGPKIRRDRFYSNSDPVDVATGGGNWADMFPSSVVMLQYDIVGVGGDYAEAMNLWTEVSRYFDHNDVLKVNIASSKLGPEDVEYPLEPQWDTKGDFRSHSSRQGLEQFTQTFLVRGVRVSPDAKSWAAFEVGEDGITAELDQIPPSS